MARVIIPCVHWLIVTLLPGEKASRERLLPKPTYISHELESEDEVTAEVVMQQ
jgi:hypothetical protein